MAKPDQETLPRKALDDLLAAFPALVRDLHDALQKTNAINAKVAAYAAMFQAHGIPIPQVEGLTVQTGQIPQIPGTQAMAMPPSAPPTSLAKAQRGMVRKYVNEMLKDAQLSVGELRERIEKKYSVRYGISSIYRILMDKETFASDAGKWRLKK